MKQEKTCGNCMWYEKVFCVIKFPHWLEENIEGLSDALLDTEAIAGLRRVNPRLPACSFWKERKK